MTPSAAPPGALAAYDRAILQSALDGRHLPPYLPGEPQHLAASLVAARVAPIVLDAVAHAHGITQWDARSFEEVFLRQAMRAWRPDLEVARNDGMLLVQGRTCPVADKVRRDPRVCDMCQLAQQRMAERALGDRLESATFPRALMQGAHVCELRLVTRR